MDEATFRYWSAKAADWGVDYRQSLRERPVRAQTSAGAIAARIAPSPPETGEPMERIFDDFETVVMPGMTHWQHPRFFAYFPANAAPVSVVAEYLVTAVAAQLDTDRRRTPGDGLFGPCGGGDRGGSQGGLSSGRGYRLYRRHQCRRLR
jgi:hypothetical protein